MRRKSQKPLQWTRPNMARANAAQPYQLQYLFLEITRHCNLNCVYCGSDCSPSWKKQELPAAQWVDILRQMADDFETKKVMVAVTGGEPLLKAGAFEIFYELRRLGFPFGMVTNGTRISPAVAQRLVDCGMGAISISLDAPPKVNDQLRGPGTATKVERGIKCLQQAGYKGKLEILSTLSKPCIPHLDSLRRYVARLRVPLWRLVPVMPIGRAALNPQLVPDAGDIRTILDYVRQGRKDQYLPKPEFGEECFLGQEYEQVVRPYPFFCRAGLHVAGILWDGSIGACPELPRDFIQGHIGKDRFRDVWRNKYQIFRHRQWTRRGICGDCDAFNTCQGGSLHLYRSADSEISRCFYAMLREPQNNAKPTTAAELRCYS